MPLVADASAVIDLVTHSSRSAAVRAVLTEAEVVAVPEHFHVEALSALRGMSHRGALSSDHAYRAMELLRALRVVRYPVMPLAREIWELRDRLTTYDAAYLAVAESIDARLLTTDAALAKAAGARAVPLAV